MLTADDPAIQAFMNLTRPRQRARINAWATSGGNAAQKRILRWWQQRGGQSPSPSPASPAHAELTQFQGLPHDQQAALISEFAHAANTPGRKLILSWWQRRGGMSPSPSPASTGFVAEKKRIKELEEWIKKYERDPKYQSALAGYRAERDRLVARVRGQKRKKTRAAPSPHQSMSAARPAPAEEPKAKHQKSEMHADSELGFPGTEGVAIEAKMRQLKARTRHSLKRIFGNVMPWRVLVYMAWKSNNKLPDAQLRSWMPRLQGIRSMGAFRHFLTNTFRDWINKQNQPPPTGGAGKTGKGFELRSSQIRKLKAPKKAKTIKKKEPTPEPPEPPAAKPRQRRQYFI